MLQIKYHNISYVDKKNHNNTFVAKYRKTFSSWIESNPMACERQRSSPLKKVMFLQAPFTCEHMQLIMVKWKEIEKKNLEAQHEQDWRAHVQQQQVKGGEEAKQCKWTSRDIWRHGSILKYYEVTDDKLRPWARGHMNISTLTTLSILSSIYTWIFPEILLLWYCDQELSAKSRNTILITSLWYTASSYISFLGWWTWASDWLLGRFISVFLWTWRCEEGHASREEKRVVCLPNLLRRQPKGRSPRVVALFSFFS